MTTRHILRIAAPVAALACLAIARKRRLSPSYMDGSALQGLVMKTMSTLDQKEVAELRQVVLNRYYTR